MKQKIFISYNSGNDLEEQLAYRMHTIGAVNGFTMYLPDRHKSGVVISDATMHKISDSDWFILFSTSQPTQSVIAEVNAAWNKFQDKNKILIVNSFPPRANPFKTWNEHATLIPFNPRKNSVESILNMINEKIQKKNQDKALLALLGIGLGLLTLAALKD